jgi:hypothetical protein
MKKVNSILDVSELMLSLFYGVQPLFAQGYGGPLTFHGIDRYQLHSAGSRAMGGLTIGLQHDIGVMFHNPAALQSLQGIQYLSAGCNNTKIETSQQYAPVRYYPNLSLLLEGLTDQYSGSRSFIVRFYRSGYRAKTVRRYRSELVTIERPECTAAGTARSACFNRKR